MGCRLMGRRPTFILMMLLTTSFFIVEIVVGYVCNSMALVADSFHMLSDIISLVVGYFALKVFFFPLIFFIFFFVHYSTFYKLNAKDFIANCYIFLQASYYIQGGGNHLTNQLLAGIDSSFDSYGFHHPAIRLTIIYTFLIYPYLLSTITRQLIKSMGE